MSKGKKRTARLVVSVVGLPQMRQLIWELVALRDDMRVGASPFADRLEHIVARFDREPEPSDYGEAEP